MQKVVQKFSALHGKFLSAQCSKTYHDFLTETNPSEEKNIYFLDGVDFMSQNADFIKLCTIKVHCIFFLLCRAHHFLRVYRVRSDVSVTSCDDTEFNYLNRQGQAALVWSANPKLVMRRFAP